MKTKENKAITLVSLVVTIIVLLILAGVSINFMFGKEGIFTKTRTAVEKYENTKNDEQSMINEIGNYIANDYMIGNRNLKLINYSISAQDTGFKWINNKTIYKKTFIGTTPNPNTVGATICQISNLNEIIDCEFKIKINSSSWGFEYAGAWELYTTTDGLGFFAHNNNFNGKDFIATIYYTINEESAE